MEAANTSIYIFADSRGKHLDRLLAPPGLEKFSGTLLPSRATCFLIFLIFCCPVNVGGCPNCIDDVAESVSLVPA